MEKGIRHAADDGAGHLAVTADLSTRKAATYRTFVEYIRWATATALADDPDSSGIVAERNHGLKHLSEKRKPLALCQRLFPLQLGVVDAEQTLPIGQEPDVTASSSSLLHRLAVRREPFVRRSWNNEAPSQASSLMRTSSRGRAPSFRRSFA